MNYNDLIFYDFETGSRNKNKTQPVQLAAVAIHGRKLEIINGSEFESLIKPVLEDEKAVEMGLDPVQDEALKVNGKTREELAKAPQLKVVWKQFVDYVNNFNYKKSAWTAPIPAGYNNNGFDDAIVDRICGPHGYNLGPWDDTWDKNSLFHPIHNVDVMKMVWQWTENNPEIKSISMDTMRDWMGMSKENAHDALTDVRQGGEMLCRFLKLHRNFAKKTKFKGAFARG